MNTDLYSISFLLTTTGTAGLLLCGFHYLLDSAAPGK